MNTSTSMPSPANPELPLKRIASTPGVCGGKPCIVGTRIRVQDIYFWHEVEGKSPDEIVHAFPQLSMADVYAALAYFWAHRNAILADVERQRREFAVLKQNSPSLLAEKLGKLGPVNGTDDPISP